MEDLDSDDSLAVAPRRFAVAVPGITRFRHSFQLAAHRSDPQLVACRANRAKNVIGAALGLGILVLAESMISSEVGTLAALFPDNEGFVVVL